MKPEKATTIYDVAREAKVSIATVSRVFNKSPRVKPETVALVLKTAAKLNFSPNASARGLSGGKQNTIGVVLPVLYGGFFSEFVFTLHSLLENEGFDIVIAGRRGSSEELFATLRKLSSKIDGLILMYHKAGIREEINSLFPGLPTVMLSRFNRFLGEADLALNNITGAKMATEHLIAQGHKKIALIEGEKGNTDAIERKEAFISATEKGGISPENIEILEGNFRQITGYYAMERLFTKRKDITAVFASKDAMAFGALNHFQSSGIRVPEDVALCGFDDIEYVQMTHPSLTSVNLNISKFGTLAFQKMTEALNGYDTLSEPSKILIEPELKIRKSTDFKRE